MTAFQSLYPSFISISISISRSSLPLEGIATMGGANAPFLYQAERNYYDSDGRFPRSSFDPKAVTRASWEPKPPPSPKKDGPLVSFNRHPEYDDPFSSRLLTDLHDTHILDHSADSNSSHVVLGPRSVFKQLGPRTKRWIQRMRGVQLGLRGLELVAAVGVLFLMIILSDVDMLTAWVLRITV